MITVPTNYLDKIEKVLERGRLIAFRERNDVIYGDVRGIAKKLILTGYKDFIIYDDGEFLSIKYWSKLPRNIYPEGYLIISCPEFFICIRCSSVIYTLLKQYVDICFTYGEEKGTKSMRELICLIYEVAKSKL